MTTKSEDILVMRVNDKTLLVDDILVVNDRGLWTTPGILSLGDERIKAIFEFLDRENYRIDYECEIAVRQLLHETNILYQIK